MEILYQVLLVFSFQSPLPIYHTSHQMSTVIFILSQNRDFRLHFCYYQLSYQVVYLYQNLTIKIITHTPLLHVTYTPDSPLYFVCVYMQPAPTLFLCVCVIILIVSSLPLFVCLRVKCLMHTGFVGQCDETSIPYCILGYRVYRIIITILIVTSNTSDSSAVGAGIKCMASTRFSNNLQLYTHNKKYSKEFSKKT